MQKVDIFWIDSIAYFPHLLPDPTKIASWNMKEIVYMIVNINDIHREMNTGTTSACIGNETKHGSEGI